MKRDYTPAGLASTLDDYRKFAVVEAVRGRQWRAGESNRNPARGSTAGTVVRIYRLHRERLYGSLMLQTHLKICSGASRFR